MEHPGKTTRRTPPTFSTNRLRVIAVLCGLIAAPIAATVEARDDAAAEDRRPSINDAPGDPFPWRPDEREDNGYWRRNLLLRWGSDQKYLLTTWWGAEFRRPGFVIPFAVNLALASSAGGSQPGLDERLARALRGGDGRRDDRVAEGLSRLGDSRTGIVLLGGTYLVARWGGNQRLARSSSLAAEALLSAGLWNVALKRLTKRTRPVDGGNGEFFVQDPDGEQMTTSFPSGHAMGAFAMATVFADEYRDKRWVPWITYGTAGLIGASRISLGRHFPSDVIAGALLGHSLGKMVGTRQHGFEDRRRYRLEPVFDPGMEGYGVRYVYAW